MATDISKKLEDMRVFYASGQTRTYAFRKAQLGKLKKAVLDYEEELYSALEADLKKNAEESWITELGFVTSEISHTLSHLSKWMKKQRVSTNLLNFPSSSFVLHEPKGVVLIIGPWNYPLQLLFTPLIGAVAAGNCVVLKPSEFSVNTTRVMEKIIAESFPPEYIMLVTGDGATVVPSMMKAFRFDHVFYTGSTNVGRKVYELAANQLVPVTLELGGKSPCVVESDANLKVAARRIAVTKFSNAGQMCVAPDYLLVQESVKSDFIETLKQTILQFYSADASLNYNFGKIINERQFDRLISYLTGATIIHGGKHDRSKLFIEPTLIDINIKNGIEENPLLKEEIFGPVLPIISFETFEEAKSLIDRNAHPLAFYVFTSNKKKEERWLASVSFGGGCVNNASWHLTNPNLPFGGIGNSGVGYYHGKHSFEVFSHHKAIMKTPTWFDPAVKYPPFKGKLGLFKKIVR